MTRCIKYYIIIYRNFDSKYFLNGEIMEKIFNKYELLLDYIRRLEQVTIAFSGGVDSVFLLKAASDAVGADASAVICRLASFQNAEYESAVSFCSENSINYAVIEINELEDERFCQNPPDRCYICKKNIFSRIKEYSENQGCIHILEGTNADDMNDYRPGMKALSELGIKSPLREIGFTKNEIRLLSKELGLSTWNKPSLACLSTRIPYGDRITERKLRMAEEAENFLSTLGFSQLRVRIHGDTARIEVPSAEFMTVINDRIIITEKLRQIGFTYISLDLLGFRSGSLNEILKK